MKDYVTEQERKKNLIKVALTKLCSCKDLKPEIKNFVDSIKWYFDRHQELTPKQYNGLMKIYERQK